MLSRRRPAALFLGALVLASFAGVGTRWAGASQSRVHAARAHGGVVRVDGTARWHGQAVTSGLAWSERHDALAFAGRDASGAARLVVLIVDDELEPASFSWPVPTEALPARAVTWLGDGRVGVGPSELRPKMVAEYRLAR